MIYHLPRVERNGYAMGNAAQKIKFGVLPRVFRVKTPSAHAPVRRTKNILDDLESIHLDIETALQASAKYAGVTSSLRSDFGRLLDSHSEDAEFLTVQKLGIWLGIFEQCIQWLSSFHDLIGDTVKEGLSTQLISPYAVIGTSIAQAVSIRRLCLAGLDTPARSILRNEAMSVLCR